MSIQTIVFIKYVVAILLLGFVVCLPAYLAQQTKKDKTDMARIRIASWLLGWTFIAWLWSLFKSTQK
jgi:hypothetical protein